MSVPSQSFKDEALALGKRAKAAGRQLAQVSTADKNRALVLMADQIEAKVLDRFRWWTVAELANPTEAVTPLSLSQIVTRYVNCGAPQGPLEVEVLVD